MNPTRFLAVVVAAVLSVVTSWGAAAAPPVSVILPAPDTTGGKPLMQAFKERHSSREFSREALPLPVMSNLLWAAAGVNRPESGKRTVPSAKDWREIDVYVATVDGLYRYDAREHALKLVVAGDLRALTGRQAFVKDAPVNLVYVADVTRMDRDTGSEDQALYAAIDTGVIVQNVYLYCASQGLATVVRGWVDREPLARAMQLGPGQRIQLAQSVGYPRR